MSFKKSILLVSLFALSSANAVETVESFRAALLEKVSQCGWKAVPESGGFAIGMNLALAKQVAAKAKLKLECSDSKPITGGSMSEMVQKMMNDPYKVNGEDRAWTQCTTSIDRNRIFLSFFKTSEKSDVFLGSAYNSLDSYKKTYPFDTVAAASPVKQALTEKYGFPISGGSCDIDTGIGYRSKFTTTFSMPFPDRTPQQPNMGLFFVVQDENLIKVGGAITKARDDNASANEEKSQKQDLKRKADSF
jgi:hypothetical protein